MAAPIQHVARMVKTKEEKEDDALQSLLSVVAQNKESLEETIRLMQELHESGVLEALNSMLIAKDKISKIVVEQALRPEATTLINNMMSAMGELTRLDPETTSTLMHGLSEGMAEGKKSVTTAKKMGIFNLTKALKDPDVSRALQFGLGFLRGFGKSL